jgi:hypothetical protein
VVVRAATLTAVCVRLAPLALAHRDDALEQCGNADARAAAVEQVLEHLLLLVWRDLVKRDAGLAC